MIATPVEVHAKHLELGYRSAGCEACYPPPAPPSRRITHRLPLRPGGRGTSSTSPQPVGSRPLQAAASATPAGTAG